MRARVPPPTAPRRSLTSPCGRAGRFGGARASVLRARGARSWPKTAKRFADALFLSCARACADPQAWKSSPSRTRCRKLELRGWPVRGVTRVGSGPTFKSVKKSEYRRRQGKTRFLGRVDGDAFLKGRLVGKRGYSPVGGKGEYGMPPTHRPSAKWEAAPRNLELSSKTSPTLREGAGTTRAEKLSTIYQR